MPLDFEKRHILTIGSIQDFSVLANVFAGL